MVAILRGYSFTKCRSNLGARRKMIEFTLLSGLPVYIDPEHIVALDQYHPDEGCNIQLSTGNSYRVVENVSQVMTKIQE